MTSFRIKRTLGAGCALLLWPTESPAQAPLPRWEIGAQFALVRFVEFEPDREFVRRQFGKPVPSGTWADSALGVRLTLNVTPAVAIDAVANYFPRALRLSQFEHRGGRKMQFLLGPKIGHRWHKGGLFATVRPGIISFEQFPSLLAFPANLDGPISYWLALQPAVVGTIGLGGATELYLSHNTTVRFDVGNTRVLYRKPEPEFLTPDFHRDNLQVSVGVAKRF
jgi:hypothetical protein